MFSSHLPRWLPNSLTDFCWEDYLNKSFAPKPLAKQLPVVESPLRHKWMHSNSLTGHPWKSRAVLFHLHISAKLAFYSVNKTLNFSHTLWCSSLDPASYFSCASQISPSCPLKTSLHNKLPFTHNLLRFLLFSSLNWNLIHSQRCHFPFSFSLGRSDSFFHLSHTGICR